MVYEERACGFGRCAGVEGATEWSQNRGDIFVKVPHFADYGACEFGGIGREMWEGESALCVLDLELLDMVEIEADNGILHTNLLAASPYMATL